jgi:two-component system OmpR family sensor kinase
VPLRIRLVLILVLLLALALAAIESITYNSVRASSISTVDSQMKSAVTPWISYYNFRLFGGPPQQQLLLNVQTGTYSGLYNLEGTLVPVPGGGNPVDRCEKCTWYPNLPSNYFSQIAASSAGAHGIFGSYSGSRGASSFRVLGTLVTYRGSGALVLVVAFPLTGVNSTMGHILTLELVIGACILLALAAASWFLVRLGLRPLQQMARTASEIAAGDLSKRVEDADERTEVGQLGASLNVMLAQIERAFREREASEERLRRFVGDASHELRTPLTSIRGYAELFKSGVAERPEDLAAALRRIESESSRMAGLVDDLLLLARLDQGRPLGHDSVDLSQLAADAVQDATVVDPARSIRMVSTGPCTVIGDEQRLRQVLGNLITNAVAYSPPGSPIEVAVHMDRVPAAGSVPAGLTGLPGLSALSGLPARSGLPALSGLPGRTGRSGRSAGAPGSDAVDAPGSEGVGSGGPNVRPLGPDDLAVPPAPPHATEDLADRSARPLGPEGAAGGAHPTGSRSSGLGAFGSGPAGIQPKPAPWEGTRASVAVIDHGPGIAAESRPYVFERFWRADPSRKRASGGTGLGLAIVAAVVAAHGGEVTIRETPGGGATFVVELPAPEVSNGPVPDAGVGHGARQSG